MGYYTSDPEKWRSISETEPRYFTAAILQRTGGVAETPLKAAIDLAFAFEATKAAAMIQALKDFTSGENAIVKKNGGHTSFLTEILSHLIVQYTFPLLDGDVSSRPILKLGVDCGLNSKRGHNRIAELIDHGEGAYYDYLRAKDAPEWADTANLLALYRSFLYDPSLVTRSLAN